MIPIVRDVVIRVLPPHYLYFDIHPPAHGLNRTVCNQPRAGGTPIQDLAAVPMPGLIRAQSRISCHRRPSGTLIPTAGRPTIAHNRPAAPCSRCAGTHSRANCVPWDECTLAKSAEPGQGARRVRPGAIQTTPLALQGRCGKGFKVRGQKVGSISGHSRGRKTGATLTESRALFHSKTRRVF